MNTSAKFTGLLLTLFAAASCGIGSSSSQAGSVLESCPVVGTYVQVGDSKVLSCDQKLLADTIRLPLSSFTGEMEIIKLDNRDEALRRCPSRSRGLCRNRFSGSLRILCLRRVLSHG